MGPARSGRVVFSKQAATMRDALSSGLVPGSGTDAMMRAVEEQLGHPLRLQFPHALEQRFRHDAMAVRRRNSFAMLGIVALYDLLLLPDLLIAPDLMRQALWVRLGVVTPCWLALAFATDRLPRRSWQVAGQGLAALAACLGAVVLELGASGPHASAYQGMAPLVLLMLGLLSSLPFVPMLAVGSAALAAYAAGLVMLQRFPANLAVCFLLLHGLTAGLALAGNWRMHRAERRAYLLTLRETLRAEALDDENRALLELSNTDALTGAANRRMFDAELELAWQGEPGGRVAVLMVDVDHFKAYNDRYGHQAGDRCLALVARAMQQQLRLDIDLLARYGGEEFAIILPNADLGDAGMIAERVRRAVDALAIAHEASPAADHVTISVGFAAGERGPNRPDRLVQGADAALYQAKQAGRNRIAPPLVVSPEKALAHALAGRRRGR